MKTTIDIADVLLLKAKRFASKRESTLRQVLESALQLYLDSNTTSRQDRFRLKSGSFQGDGLVSGVDGSNWEQIRGLAYGDRE